MRSSRSTPLWVALALDLPACMLPGVLLAAALGYWVAA